MKLNKSENVKSLLKIKREEKNMTQEEVADDLGIGRSHYSSIEGSKKKPSLDLAKKIADYFSVSMDELFFQKKKSG